MVAPRSIRTTIAILAALWLIGCDAYKQSPDPPPLQPVPKQAYLPFVESLHLPDTIVEGTPIIVEIELSAELNPFVLGAEFPQLGETVIPVFSAGSGPLNQDVGIQPLFPVQTNYGPVVSTYSLTLPPLTAGQHKVYVRSADSRQHGGLLLTDVEKLYEHPNFMNQTYTINVQPAP